MTDHFNDLFAPLYIVGHPAPWYSKHLILKFPSELAVLLTKWGSLSTTNPIGFIEKYTKELGHPEVVNLIKDNDPTQSLEDALVSTILVRCVNTCLDTNMFNIKKLAGNYGHTLFVRVDKYDAPVNNSAFIGDTMGGAIKKVSQIEPFFKGVSLLR